MIAVENKKFSIFVKILVFIIFAVLIVSLYFNDTLMTRYQNDTSTSNINNSTQNNSISQNVSSYSNVTNVSYPTPSGVSNFSSGTSQLATINNSDTIVTFNSTNVINIHNIPENILTGFAYTDEINLENCINQDQLAVNYIQKTCQGLRCLDSFGNIINNGEIIENMANRASVEKCNNQNLGYLSFNFGLNSLEVSDINPFPGIVSSNTLFMEVKNIYAGTNIYNELISNKKLDYYFKNNLFIEDTGICVNSLIPRIVHSTFEANDFRQKIIIKKYTKTGTSFTENNTGNLAELIFRPGQLFLDSEEVNNSIQKITTSLNDGNQGNIYSGDYNIRTISQGSNLSAKCIIDTNSNIIIIQGGQGFDNSLGVSILDNNSNLRGNFNIGTNLTSKQIIFNQRVNYTDEQRAVWLLVPPTNLTPEGVTKNNKLTNGYILNFSNQSAVPNIGDTISNNSLPVYNKVIPGTIISPIQLNNITTNLPDFINLKSYDSSEGKYNGQPVSYYENFKALFGGETEGNLFTQTSSFKINQEAYKQYPPYILKSVNPYPMFADPKSIIMNGDISVFVFQYTAKKGTFYGDISYTYGLGVGISTTNNGLNFVSDGIILDGAAEWEQIDPFSNTISFRNEYFNNVSIREGVSPINKITNITKNNLSFIPAILGKLSSININNISYENINFPNLTDPLIIPFNSTNLIPESGSGASVGENASGVLTFIKNGTSTIIQSAQIINTGFDYESGTFSLNGESFEDGLQGTVDDIVLTSINETYTYKAIAMYNNSPINLSDTNDIQSFNISYGLIIDPETNEIINGGQNYTVGMNVYINQLIAGTENSIFGTSFNQNNISVVNMKRLPFITVKGISSVYDNSLIPSPYPLFNNNNQDILFNLWEDTPGTYLECPQQIVYYGDFIGTSLPYIGDPAIDFSAFLYNNRIADSQFTEIEFLTSLQIPTFYYQNIEDNISGVCGYEGLALKRFIPYREFNPPVRLYSEEIPIGTGTNTFVNYNYCQFIPYGIKTVYNKQFSSYDVIPTF